MHGGLTSRRYFFIELFYRIQIERSIKPIFYGNKDDCYRHSSRLPKYTDIKWSNHTKNKQMYKSLRWVIKSMLKYYNQL